MSGRKDFKRTARSSQMALARPQSKDTARHLNTSQPKMRPTLFTSTLAVAGLAAPLTKRVLTPNDQSVLSFALYLEHLEHALYSGAYANFTDAQFTSAGFPSGFRDNVGVIATHEQQHADIIAATLAANGAPYVPPCTYSFPYTDPTSFVSLANMITSVGIGAYLGGSEVSIPQPSIPSSLLT